MKLQSIFLLAGIALAPCLMAQELSNAQDPYVMLGCTLDTSKEVSRYITSSITYGYNGGGIYPSHITCAQNLESSQYSYDIVNVSAVGDEIVYTLKHK